MEAETPNDKEAYFVDPQPEGLAACDGRHRHSKQPDRHRWAAYQPGLHEQTWHEQTLRAMLSDPGAHLLRPA